MRTQNDHVLMAVDDLLARAILAQDLERTIFEACQAQDGCRHWRGETN
ncbi:hypothetical protein [Rothia sp. P7208]